MDFCPVDQTGRQWTKINSSVCSSHGSFSPTASVQSLHITHFPFSCSPPAPLSTLPGLGKDQHHLIASQKGMRSQCRLRSCGLRLCFRAVESCCNPTSRQQISKSPWAMLPRADVMPSQVSVRGSWDRVQHGAKLLQSSQPQTWRMRRPCPKCHLAPSDWETGTFPRTELRSSPVACPQPPTTRIWVWRLWTWSRSQLIKDASSS